MPNDASHALPPIPIFDLDGEPPVALLESARARVDAILDRSSFLTPRPVLALGDRRTRAWLERAGSPYFEETAAVAEALGRPGGWFMNLNYEWACTAGVAPAPGGGNRLLRVLDWRQPGLGRNVVAVRRQAAAGSWIDLTWPGFTGALQALAPGRFAASINQAPLKRVTGLLVFDWLAARIRTGERRALPPSHLLRLAFETAPDYAEAKRLLTETPVALPVIFTLCGPEPGEGCVIERLEDRAFVREAAEVATANHWIEVEERARPRGVVSETRCRLMEQSQAAADEDFAWVTPPILNPMTRLAMMAEPASGRLVARGYEPEGAVTAILTLNGRAAGERAQASA